MRVSCLSIRGGFGFGASRHASPSAHSRVCLMRPVQGSESTCRHCIRAFPRAASRLRGSACEPAASEARSGWDDYSRHRSSAIGGPPSCLGGQPEPGTGRLGTQGSHRSFPEFWDNLNGRDRLDEVLVAAVGTYGCRTPGGSTLRATGLGWNNSGARHNRHVRIALQGAPPGAGLCNEPRVTTHNLP